MVFRARVGEFRFPSSHLNSSRSFRKRECFLFVSLYSNCQKSNVKQFLHAHLPLQENPRRASRRCFRRILSTGQGNTAVIAQLLQQFFSIKAMSRKSSEPGLRFRNVCWSLCTSFPISYLSCNI